MEQGKNLPAEARQEEAAKGGSNQKWIPRKVWTQQSVEGAVAELKDIFAVIK